MEQNQKVDAPETSPRWWGRLQPLRVYTDHPSITYEQVGEVTSTVRDVVWHGGALCRGEQSIKGELGGRFKDMMSSESNNKITHMLPITLALVTSCEGSI